MNLEEIEKIEDYGLQNIRLKYWNLRHKAFLDEHGIPDEELERVWNELDKAEEKEVALYLKNKEKNDV